MERVLTPEQAAKKLKLADTTIREYLRIGTIKGVKMGTKWRIPESDLQAYINRLKEERDRHYAKPKHKFNQAAKEIEK